MAQLLVERWGNFLSMLNADASAIQAITTAVLVGVTIWYAWIAQRQA